MTVQATLDAALLRVVADPVRARIVELLAVEQLCTCHLVKALDTTQSGVSNHLRVLREAGVVVTDAHGRFTYYRLVPGVLQQLADDLAAVADDAGRAALRRRPC